MTNPETPPRANDFLADKDGAVRALEERLAYVFQVRTNLVCALTHSSFAHENGIESYERLEFLGDAVLGLAVAATLFESSPTENEGSLTRRRAAHVSETALERQARALLTPLILVGRGHAGQELKGSIVADVAEAVIGAIFVEAGLDAARGAVARWLGPPPLDEEEPDNPKNRLQEYCQRTHSMTPTYVVRRMGGPDHAPVFEATVTLPDGVVGLGEGISQKQASASAATHALEQLQAR